MTTPATIQAPSPAPAFTGKLHRYLGHVTPELRAHWCTHAQVWLQAAYQGDAAGLGPSLGQGFWTHWRSAQGGRPPIYLLVTQGKAPGILEMLVRDGLDVVAPSPDGADLAHELLTHNQAMVAAWMTALHPHGVIWTARKNQHSFMLALIARRQAEAVSLLISWGVPLPTPRPRCPIAALTSKTDPVCLALNGDGRLTPMLRVLYEHGCSAKRVSQDFYPRAIRAGLHPSALPWCEAWGLSVPAPQQLWDAVLTHDRVHSAWVTHLINQGASLDDPWPLQPRNTVRQVVEHWLGLSLAGVAWRNILLRAVATGEAKCLERVLPAACPRSPRPRL